MTDTITTSPAETPPLATVAAKISEAHQNCVASQLNALQHALECGRLAVAAKSQLKHGEFLPWTHEHTSVGRRTMQVYMDIATRWPTVKAKALSTAHLSMAAALKLLAAERRMESARPVIGAAGDDVATDMVGDKPTLNAATVKKLAKLLPEEIERATRFENSDTLRTRKSKGFLKRCKVPDDSVEALSPMANINACSGRGKYDPPDDCDCANCSEPIEEITRPKRIPLNAGEHGVALSDYLRDVAAKWPMEHRESLVKVLTQMSREVMTIREVNSA